MSILGGESTLLHRDLRPDCTYRQASMKNKPKGSSVTDPDVLPVAVKIRTRFQSPNPLIRGRSRTGSPLYSKGEVGISWRQPHPFEHTRGLFVHPGLVLGGLNDTTR